MFLALISENQENSCGVIMHCTISLNSLPLIYQGTKDLQE